MKREKDKEIQRQRKEIKAEGRGVRFLGRRDSEREGNGRG